MTMDTIFAKKTTVGMVTHKSKSPIMGTPATNEVIVKTNTSVTGTFNAEIIVTARLPIGYPHTKN